MSAKLSRSALGALAVALAIAGCGSGQSTTPVIRAADVTARSPGYRLAGTATISVQGGQGRSSHMTMNGSFDRRDRVGTMTAVAGVLGHSVRIPEVLSHLTVYMPTKAVPNATKLAPNKRWLKLDMSRAVGGAGISSLPTATDPSQFVDYLRAVSSGITNDGGATVRGVHTTHYHATIDLDRYPRLVAPSRRQAVAASVENLEATLQSHTMPLDVWIDRQHLVRRIALNFGECVSGAHFRFAMSADLYDYGPQPRPKMPSASQTYDLTPLLQTTMERVKVGCTRS